MTTPTSLPHQHDFRTFLILCITQSFSYFGTILALFAVDIWLAQSVFPAETQKAQLGVAFSAIQLAGSLPGVLGAPFAGSWADRHDRKHTMLWADALNGVVSGVMLMLLFFGQLHLPFLVILIALASLIGLFHRSAFDTSYALLVSEAQLPRANSLMQTLPTLAQLFAPTAAAALMTLPSLVQQVTWPGALGRWVTDVFASTNSGFALTIAIDLVTFWVAALVLIRLIVPSPPQIEKARPKGNFWDDVKLGFRFVITRPAHVRLLMGVVLANVIFGFLWVNVPLIVKFNLAADWSSRGWGFEAALAFIVTSSAVAGVIAGFVISAWGGLKRNRIYGVLAGLIGYGLGCALFGFANSIYLAAAAQFISICALMLLNVHSQTIWQTTTPPEVQGRVFAVRRLIGYGAGPISTAIGGLIGGRFDPGLSVGILSSVCTLFFIVLLFDGRLRRIESTPLPSA